MYDPKLRRRRPRAKPTSRTSPTRHHFLTEGESDRIAPVPYGEADANSFPSARFELIPEAGHRPQIEQPEETLRRIRPFAAETTVAVSV